MDSDGSGNECHNKRKAVDACDVTDLNERETPKLVNWGRNGMALSQFAKSELLQNHLQTKETSLDSDWDSRPCR